MPQGAGVKVRLYCLAFAGRYRLVCVPAPLTQHHFPLPQRIAGLADLLGTVAVERNLIARELLFLPIDLALHKA